MTRSRGPRRSGRKPPEEIAPSTPAAPSDPGAPPTASGDGPVGQEERGELAAPEEPAEVDTFPVVGVGASAGGLEAFTQLLEAAPPDTGMAFVLVQHLSPTHPSALAEILSRSTTMPVVEVRNEPAVEPNHVYVIPPGQDMIMSGGRLHLQPREGGGVTHRPVDRFFRALAEDRRHRAIGVVLSGTATDGTLGLEAIKAEGGITFAQDSTARHEGMPHSAIASGCVDFVLAPDQIAAEIVRISRHPYTAPGEETDAPSADAVSLRQVLRRLHNSTGVDFTNYKFNTLYRRIRRRMVLAKLDDPAEYVALLRADPAEVEALYHDILISVTSFFRNPEAFEVLKEKVFPRLVKDRSPQDPVRLWTLGCSTGQEVYSLAIAYAEFAAATGTTARLQAFATDLDNRSVDTARAGVYSRDIAQDVSPERLRRFFVEVDAGYRVSKSIRDVCVFSRHNVLIEPPFSRMDLISCRNLLIYLDPVLQQRIVPLLHYALKPSGFLWLGSSESIGADRSLFEAEDAKHKIYARKPASHGALFPLRHGGAPRLPFTPIAAQRRDAGDELHRHADRLLLDKFTPPSVLVSADLNILQYRGDVGPYLAPTSGKASLHLLKMLRGGLLVALRQALARAEKERVPVRAEAVRVESNDGHREVTVEVVPLAGGGGSDARAEERGFLILFEDASTSGSRGAAGSEESGAPSPRAPVSRETDANLQDAPRLARELEATRDYLQSVVEQQEAANEELQSANEEVQSANEELQSINEELETSKEEIESSNEELATLNDELNNRNHELGRLNSDIVNLLSSTQLPVVMLAPDLRIRQFTPAAERLLELLPTDVGRRIGVVKIGFDLPDLEAILAEVIDTARELEREVRDASGRWYSLRLRPYRTLDNEIDGVVMVLVDVDLIKRAQEFQHSIVATVGEPLLVLDADLRVRMANRSFHRTFEVRPDETDGRLLHEIGNGQWNIPALRRLLEEVLPRDLDFTDFELEHEFENIGRRTMLVSARRLLQLSDSAPSILLSLKDVTADRSAAEVAARLAAIVTSSEDAIISKDLDGFITSWNRGAEHLFGYTAEEAVGKPITMLIPPDRIDEEPRILEQVVRGEAIEHYETVRRRKDGSTLDISVTVSPLIDAAGRVVGASKIARDITAGKRVEQALRDSERRLRQYAVDLSEADRRKNEFLAMLAHELRNPLAPMRNALQLFNLGGVDPAELPRILGILDRQVEQIARLVDDLIDVSRISRGKIALHKQKIDLASIVSQAVEAVSPLHESRHQTLTVSLPEQPVYLHADPIRLVQVVGNLLNNACKFTGERGSIELDVERSGADVAIRVNDSGIGIAADQLSSIFDIFVQADTSLERSVSGLGIGLTLVKMLVELHSGTVEAHSEGLGLGTEMVVRLPALAELPSREVPAAEAGAGARTFATPRRILVVDDNRDAAESLAMLLQLSGNVTQVAYDGRAALAAAEAFRPEVVLLDIGLPKVNGYEVARRIRKQPWGRTIVLVAVTGWGQDEDRQKARDAGFVGHLVKPVDHAALATLLTDLPIGAH